MAIKYIKGDIIKDADSFEVIAHQCNCFQSFGAGIAKAIKINYPKAYLADLQTRYGDKEKMGTISYTLETTPIIVNLYGQYRYSRDKVDTDYVALGNALKAMKTVFAGKKIGLPTIGAGLAKGDFSIIKEIIEKELSDEDVTIVIYEKETRQEILDLLPKV